MEEQKPASEALRSEIVRQSKDEAQAVSLDQRLANVPSWAIKGTKLTPEGRTSHALHLSNTGWQAGAPVLLAVGGLHAREWGSSEKRRPSPFLVTAIR